MKTRLALAILFLFFPLLALAEEARITYVSGNTVYFDAGLDRGVGEGDPVEVVRDGQVVGRLRVTYLTSSRASAEPEGDVPALAVGDVVRFTPREAAPASPATPGAAPESRPRRSLAEAGISGRVGVRWLYVKDRTARGGDFSQPALDLRLVGRQVGGAPVDFAVDLRPRKTYRNAADGTSEDTSSNRIYQMNASWRPGPFRLVVGRQSSPSVAPLSLYDGLLFEYRLPRFAVGGFYGTEPDPEDWSYASDVKDAGVFVETGSAPGAPTRWSLGLGAVSSTEQSEVNRDFVYLSGRIVHGGFSGILLQQVDYNRGWRKDVEDSSFTRTGSFVSLRWRAGEAWSLFGGWDSRRNVRLYRDFVTPVTDFDDAYRQGYWGGAQWLGDGRWLVGADARFSRGGSAGSADAFTLNLGAVNLTTLDLDVRLRGTHYTGPYLDGDLASLAVSLDAGERVRLEAHGGVRDEQDNFFVGESRTVHWIGAGADFLVQRRLWATLNYDRTAGGDEDNDQVYASVSWRF
jgi:hypothetical protein